jgi:hypothetical protein
MKRKSADAALNAARSFIPMLPRLSLNANAAVMSFPARIVRDPACRKRQRHTEGHSLKTSAQLANRSSLSVLDVWLFLCAELLSLTPLEVCAMYELTLTREERKAIDWIGHRYSNGDNLAKLLANLDQTPASGNPDDDWSCDTDITFHVPEHVAWTIAENAANEDGYWPCFAPELAEKMQRFVDAIV